MISLSNVVSSPLVPVYNERMLLILTHENADFDAVASQLAAHKLYPEGVALLSWRVNRNVEQFLTLYWDAFAFMKPRDWRRRKIERVLLVDTVTLPSVRGVRADRIRVQIIDHHDDLEIQDLAWDYHSEIVGATTTILIEMLQAAGLGLTANEATLLLLGIHEDTGSLVYDTTTARDAQAAAWLLEQGAQLSVVRRFLNIPLSDQQQALNESLESAVEWITVEGQNIVISAVKAPNEFDDEISAVAHRLRDTLMPDGMFLVVQLKYNHVQLVARSDTDNVDVSIIARFLGGGGHSRAAAATIMDQSLTEVRRQIVDWLPGIVQPVVKVAQIMSYGLQTISSNAPVSEAANQMQRSGHEGYPVVDPSSGQLVGLLTRRLVDRAIGHQLSELPVSRVMRAGQITVTPSDSVEKVQRIMAQEGWGQIPVISDDADPNQPQAVIGIVTRTDLINLLTNEVSAESEPDMRQLMIDSLPDAIWDMLQIISNSAGESEMPLYFVGGLVRDLLVGRPSKDIDMVTEGDAIALVGYLRETYGGEIRSHQQFGTAKWLLSPAVWRQVAPDADLTGIPLVIDFVTARTEFYDRPSALPEVERGSIKLDLHRRDFTINTLAVRLDGAHLGELLDFYGGLRDLSSGLIRVLHSLSFVDDPTRILRAVRLEQRLGFTIESRTSELINAAMHMLNRVTGERIRNELEMCLREEKRIQMMARLAEFGVLAQIHPGLTWHNKTAELFYSADVVLNDNLFVEELGEVSCVFVYFAALILPLVATVQEEVMARLKVRTSTRDDVFAAHRLLQELAQQKSQAQPSDVYKTLQPYRERVLALALVVVGIDSESGGQINSYLKEWRHVRPSLNGNDLLNMGLKAGPEIGLLLEKLLDARLDGKLSDRAAELLMVGDLLNDKGELRGS